MIAFIDAHREAYGVEPICRVLQIAPWAYHAHLAQRTDPAKASPAAIGCSLLRSLGPGSPCIYNGA